MVKLLLAPVTAKLLWLGLLLLVAECHRPVSAVLTAAARRNQYNGRLRGHSARANKHHARGRHHRSLLQKEVVRRHLAQHEKVGAAPQRHELDAGLVSNASSMVDVFVGSANHGHTSPQATTPWGMAQVTAWGHGSNTWDSESGYASDTGKLTFFGMAHTALSGAGSGEMGELRLRPSSLLDDQPTFLDFDSTKGSPGFFETRVGTGDGKSGDSIGIQSAASPRGAVHNFAFPVGQTRNVDLHLEPPPNAFYGNKLDDHWLEAKSDQKVEGCSLNLLMGWGAPPSVLCFVLQFDQPFTSSLIQGQRMRGEDFKTVTLSFADASASAASSSSSLMQSTDASSVTARVGVSRTDIEHARDNFAVELEGKSLADVATSAKKMWDQELGAVRLSMKPLARQKAFYSALYHAMIAPNLVSDVDGSYRIQTLPEGHDFAPSKGDPYFWSDKHLNTDLSSLDVSMPIRKAPRGVQYGTFSLWDTYRSLHPLYNLVRPEKARDFAESLMTYAEEWKMLPHSLVYSSTSDMMSGDGGGIVLAATARSGLIDQERALNVLKMERLAPTDEKKFLERSYPAQGSGSILETDTAPASLDDDEEHNSMTNDIADRVQEQGISKALEQAMADSCVGRLAQDMGKAEDAAFFTKRSQTVRKYWSKEQHLYEKFDLADLDEENRQEADFTEGTPLQYSFAGQFDVDWQIKARGGREKFACDLKNFFEKAPEPSGQPDVAGNFHGASMGNEPCMHTPYLFSLLGYPEETQRVVDKVVKTAYSDTPGGIPGNDDMGEMSSWLVFSDLGFYPADPCSGGLALGRPFVDHAILTVKGGSLELVVQNQSEDNAYIQQAHWNGKLLEKSVIPFRELEAGGKLELVMGSKPVQASLKC